MRLRQSYTILNEVVSMWKGGKMNALAMNVAEHIDDIVVDTHTKVYISYVSSLFRQRLAGTGVFNSAEIDKLVLAYSRTWREKGEFDAAVFADKLIEQGYDLQFAKRLAAALRT